MKLVDQFADLICCKSLVDWRNAVFSLGKKLGFEQTMLAILPNRETPLESKYAFQHSNYSSEWLNKYNEQKLGYIDPTVAHIATKSTPLIWSPDVFSQCGQEHMYEEASSYGLRSGVSLPIHGMNGELGILCCVSDASQGNRALEHIAAALPELSCFRDFVFESSARFIKATDDQGEMTRMTRRELEVLKWCAAGKSSWEIGRILSCSEATVNFHFGNIRRKLNSRSRQQAVVKAIRLGLI